MASNFSVQYDAVDLPKGATAQARRLKVAWRGRPIAAFSQSAHRAYVYPVFTPAGVAVTGEMPIDHPHHNSITVGADHFNCHFQYATGRLEDGTYNFYINDVFQGRAPGRTLAVSTDSRELSERHLRVVQQVHWQGPVEWGAPDRRTVATETRTIDIHPGDAANVFDLRSELTPTEWDVSIGPTRHAYFTVRLTDGLRIDDGAEALDSEGRRTSEEITPACRALGGRNGPRTLRTPRGRGRRPPPIGIRPPLGHLRLGHHSRQPVPGRQLRPEAGQHPRHVHPGHSPRRQPRRSQRPPTIRQPAALGLRRQARTV